MFSFQNGPEFLIATRNRFMGTSHGQGTPLVPMFFFDSQLPPNGIQDVPFDLTNPIDVASNCVGFTFANFQFLVDLMALEYSGLPFQVGSDPFNMMKSPYLDATRSLWRVFPKFMVRESAWTAFREGTQTWNDISNAHRDTCTYHSLMTNDPDQHLVGTSTTQMFASASRYHYTDPLVIEFQQETTLTAMSFMQTHSGGSYDNTYFDLSAWDASANSGQGGWGTAQRISYSGGNTKNEITFPQEMIGTRFRISGQDTGSQGWIWKHLSLFSSVEPAHAPFDVGWALLGMSSNGVTSLFSGAALVESNVDTDGNNAISGRPDANLIPNNLPWLLMSVGDATGEGAISLSNATGITGREYVNPQFARISFE